MKKNKFYMLLVICLPIIAASCKKSSSEGNTSTELDKFLIVTSITNGSAPVSYTGTFKDLSVTSQTNSKSRQSTLYPFSYIFEGNVFLVPNRYGDVLKKYSRGDNGTLNEAGSLTLPASSQSIGLAFKSSTEAYCSLSSTGKIAVFNPAAMTLTRYIDLTAYGLSSGTPVPTIINFHKNKLYVAVAQTTDSYSSVHPAQLLIIDLANNDKITSVTDSRTTYAGSLDAKNSIFFDEKDDLYLYCVGSYGFVPGQKAGFLRIKSGQNIFDPSYFFNTTDIAIPGINGGISYLNNMAYTDGGLLYASGNLPSLMSNPPNYVTDHPYGIFKLDLIAKTITKLPFPYSTGYANCVYPYQGKILVSLSTTTGVGIYSYDPATNTGSANPIITTQGDPTAIEAF